MSIPAWSLRGTYLEACNCVAVCPCRRIDGGGGGRSTFGECTGALSWRIEEGGVGDADLAGRAVVMVIWYSDDEPGSPWRWELHVDEEATPEQVSAIEDVWTGARGGTPLKQFPWAFKTSTLLAVIPSRIEIDHTPGRGWFRAGNSVTLRVAKPFEQPGAVSCIIPGHHRDGREVVAEVLETSDEHFQFRFEGRCGYESTFAYSGP